MFDIGNVVIECEHAITHRRLQAYGVPKEVTGRFFDDDFLDFARGTLTPEQFYARLAPKGINITFEQAKEAFQNHLYAVDKKVVKILEELRDSLPEGDLGFLTDCNIWQVEKVEGPNGLINFSNYSPIVFRSCEIGMIKHDKGLFPYVTEKLGRKPSEILLIDDNPGNNAMAEKYGGQTLLYRYPAQLRHDLEERRILRRN